MKQILKRWMTMNKTGTIILIIFLFLIAVGLGLFAFFYSVGAIQLNGNYFNLFSRQSTTLIDSKEFDKVENIYIKFNDGKWEKTF